jgi:hypothetical protein
MLIDVDVIAQANWTLSVNGLLVNVADNDLCYALQRGGARVSGTPPLH